MPITTTIVVNNSHNPSHEDLTRAINTLKDHDASVLITVEQLNRLIKANHQIFINEVNRYHKEAESQYDYKKGYVKYDDDADYKALLYLYKILPSWYGGRKSKKQRKSKKGGRKSKKSRSTKRRRY